MKDQTPGIAGGISGVVSWKSTLLFAFDAKRYVIDVQQQIVARKLFVMANAIYLARRKDWLLKNFKFKINRLPAWHCLNLL